MKFKNKFRDFEREIQRYRLVVSMVKFGTMNVENKFFQAFIKFQKLLFDISIGTFPRRIRGIFFLSPFLFFLFFFFGDRKT